MVKMKSEPDKKLESKNNLMMRIQISYPYVEYTSMGE